MPQFTTACPSPPRPGPSKTWRERSGPTSSSGAQEQAHVLGLVIPDDAGAPEFTRSEGEERLKRLCKAARLPAPRMNARVAGWEVDAFWPAARLVVEIDGWRYHRTRRRFEDDRRKDAALQVAGYRVVRITWRRLRYESYAVAAELAVLLRPA